ncbi:MAG: phenylalanine--tRNA ligase subunit beta [Clostridia bacterium]|nr:phenylalanine--tRNA ligase subunit beta [Clostridia bacterium]
MKVSLSWLKRYVDIDVPVEELCDKMVMAGFEVEEMIDLSKSMRNVVVGKVTKMERHPDSDHMFICQVDCGTGEDVQIVTGAQNVNEGDLVPAALHDSDLPNGMHIKKGKLRGVPSNGMLCSGEELCVTEDDYPGAGVYGIMILKSDAGAPGTDMREVLGLNDYIIDFKITANRPDCQSVLGIAREAAVVLGKPFNEPNPTFKTVGESINDYINVEVKNFDLCPRYYGRVIKNVKIAESPAWMKKCLLAAGMRPISNIVDITNFVMLETGMPMHAFDLRDVKDRKIIVRNAYEGEQITTLDGKEHTLTSDMLVIADGQEPSCIAGIMGGMDSEIKDDTTEIFFECAKFRRDSVRKTARKLGMRTEASGRFERGVDIITVEYAMNRCLQLVDELGAGEVVDGNVDCNAGLPTNRELNVKVSDVVALLGIDISGEKMVEILNSLQIRTTLTDGVLKCFVPSFRDDVEGRADIAEEVMRIYGYDHIKGTAMTGAIMRGRKLPERIKADKIKDTLIANEFNEIATYSFIGSKAIDALKLTEDDARRNAVTILNPLGDEYSTMRTQLVTSMMTVLSTNYSRKVQSARLFELSKVFIPKALPVTEQPEETPALCMGLYGEGEDFFTLKGIVEAVIALFSDMAPAIDRASEPYLHPGRSAVMSVAGKKIATFGEVHPAVAEGYGIDGKVFIAEIDAAVLYGLEKTKTTYKPLPKFPAVERDLALVCDAETPVGVLENAIREGAGKLCEDIKLFDVYQGSQIAEGKKSVAYRVTLRSAEGTLTDEVIDRAVNKMIKKLDAVGATLRS